MDHLNTENRWMKVVKVLCHFDMIIYANVVVSLLLFWSHIPNNNIGTYVRRMVQMRLNTHTHGNPLLRVQFNSRCLENSIAMLLFLDEYDYDGDGFDLSACNPWNGLF